jgi:asparaginyl-tRNA synthetase
MAQISDFHKYTGQEVTVKGWVMNSRSSKGIEFIILRDGSGFAQCIVDVNIAGNEIYESAKRLTQESSVELTGSVVKDEKQIGGYELHVKDLKIIHISEEYPISNKPHGVEFLMDNRHLWLRSKRQWAIMRIRNQIIYAIHNFFQSEGFMQMDAPVFTGNACEGTTTLFSTEFYDTPAYLTQSGQLYGEAMAMAMGKIYTFGPTFRAEKSKTRRHLSEFWMIEPEMAFFDLEMNMNLIEAFIKSVVKSVLEKCTFEFQILERDTTILEKVANEKFPRYTYDDAIKILKGEMDINGKNSIKTLENDLKEIKEKIVNCQSEIAEKEKLIASPSTKKGQINYYQNRIDQLKNEIKDHEERASHIPEWIESAHKFVHGEDLGGSDETVITRLFDLPIMVYNWPHQVKAFYMKRDASNPNLAKGVDVLAPEGYGEIVGGGERETNKEWLIEKINEHGLPMEAFEWYLDLRRFGSVPHAGFGLGLERLVAWMCKLPHIRETIPFPRMYGRLLP